MLAGFTDELLKLGAGALDHVPRLPPDINTLTELTDAIRHQGERVLGYRNVALPVSVLGDLERRGFRPTRLATPLPGERLFSKTWRKGKLHAHRLGDEYFLHLDRIAPSQSLRDALSHFRQEGIPSLKQRMLEERR